MTVIIETERLTKRYKNFYAVQDVSLTIRKGEIYGFIGLNGAGKTTTIRMLLGMIQPSRGSCYIKGERVSRTNHHLWKHVGHLVETPHSYPELTVKENLELFHRLRRILEQDTVSNVLNLLNLTRYADTKAGELSLGNAQRLGIAKALLHSPEILILDEPFNGLDPAGMMQMRELLQSLAYEQGVTILVSSHLLSEVAKITSKIGIIHDGQLLQEITADELKQLLRQRLIIATRHIEAASAVLSAAGFHPTLNKSGELEIYNDDAVQHPDQVARLLVEKDHPPTRLVVEEENLESYFLQLVKNEGRGSS